MEELKLENTEQFIQDCIEKSKIDVDTEFCDQIAFKFENNEVDSDSVQLLTTPVNKRAFQFVFPEANID